MALIATRFEHPLGNGVLTQTQGDADGFYVASKHGSLLSGGGYHLGEDWNGDGGGNTDLGDRVQAVANGRVVFAGTLSASWGKVVVIQHTMPDGSIVSSLYGHLNSINVSAGQSLTMGQQIGTLGATGSVTAAHLHFSIYLGAKTTDWAGTSTAADPDPYHSGYVNPTWFINQHRGAVDAGNDFAHATALAIGSSLTASVGVGTDSNDVFKFTAAANGTVTFKLTGLSADLDLRLYNAAGTQIGVSENNGTAAEGLSLTVVAGKTYYVHVDPYSTAASNYTLSSSMVTDIAGTTGNNVLSGTAGADRIMGYQGNDTLYGNGGNDTLYGGSGNDYLSGGAGKDIFVFHTAMGSLGADRIGDFSRAQQDKIALDDAIYSGIATASGAATGTLSGIAFRANTTGYAADGTDRIIYETDTGKIYYDADGTGLAHGRYLVATVGTNLGLTATDFFTF